MSDLVIPSKPAWQKIQQLHADQDGPGVYRDNSRRQRPAFTPRLFRLGKATENITAGTYGNVRHWTGPPGSEAESGGDFLAYDWFGTGASTGDKLYLFQIGRTQYFIREPVVPVFTLPNYAGVIEPTGESGHIVQWDTDQVASVSNSDAANDRVTAGATGVYELFGGISASETSGSATLSMTLNFDVNNGGPLVFGHAATVPADGSAMATIFHRTNLTSGDHVKLICEIDGSGTSSIDAGWLSIKQVD